ncbi:hypothetical protein FIBSPDRAFT_885639 [Athelia psychrophila]|uniref:FHA domain-containing protein n=1 Tax=Athelia psychrophila TaxID=1759441 RepID=A0A166RKP8_9AGAM|nr:hypothetical protein FIBSPDRAFT_885639 [Fibularhizoctonia sp. CBS 109695]
MSTPTPTAVSLRITSPSSTTFQERTIDLTGTNITLNLGASGYPESSDSTVTAASSTNALFDEASPHAEHSTMWAMGGKLYLIKAFGLILNGEDPEGVETLQLGDTIQLGGKVEGVSVTIVVAAMSY